MYAAHRKFDPRQPYSPVEDQAQSRDTENQLFERRKLRPAKDDRPNSAKIDAKPRPVSASRRVPVLLANIGRQKVYAPAKETKPKAKPVMWDKERMAEEQLALKVENNGLRDENTKLKTRVNQLEKEVLRFGEVLDGQVSDKTNSHLVASLKQAVKELKAEVKTKDEEVTSLKKSIKATRTTELEVELQAYFDECTRLRRHLEQVMTQSSEFVNYESPFNKDSLRIQQGVAISSLQVEKESVKSQLEQAQLELERWKERAKELEKKAKKPKKSPDRQLKSELSKMRAVIDQSERAKSDLAASFELEKGRIVAESQQKDEQIRRLQARIAEAETATSALQKQSQEQIFELKSVKGQLMDMQREMVAQTKRSQGVETKNSRPGRVFEKIHRVISRKNTLPEVFFSLLDRQNKGSLDAKELQSGLRKHGIKAKSEAVEEAVLIASGGKSSVTLAQLETQFHRYEFSEVYESSSGEEEVKPKKTTESKPEPKPDGKLQQKTDKKTEMDGKKTSESKTELREEEKRAAPVSETKPTEPKVAPKPVLDEEKRTAAVLEAKPVPPPTVEEKKPSTEVAKLHEAKPVPVPSPVTLSEDAKNAAGKARKEEEVPAIQQKLAEIPPKPAEVHPKPVEIPQKPAEVHPKPVEIPQKHVEVPPKAVEIPPKPAEISPRPTEIPPKPVEIPKKPAEVCPKPAEVPSKPTEIPLKPAEIPSKPAELPQKHIEVPPKPAEIPPRQAEHPARTDTKAKEVKPVEVAIKTEAKPTPPPSEEQKAKRPASPMRAPTPTEAAKPIPNRVKSVDSSEAHEAKQSTEVSSLSVPLSPGVTREETATKEAKSEQVPKPIPLSEVADLLRHVALRLQLHRIPKDKLPLLLFGEQFDESRAASLFELQELLAQPPMNVTDAPQAETLAKFLIETEGSAGKSQGKVGQILAKLNKFVGDWLIFSTENEEEYDEAIADAVHDHFDSIQTLCEQMDTEKRDEITMSQFKSVLRTAGVTLKSEHLKYLELLFYSHDFQLDKVPYYQFLNAYSGAKEEEGDEHYSDDQYGSGDYELDEEDRRELVHSYLSTLFSALSRARRTLRQVFDVSEDNRIYPPEFIFGVRSLGIPELRKEDLMVVLESLQDDTAEELCISLPYLEEVLQQISSQEYDEVQEAESSEMEYSEDSPERGVKKSTQLSDGSPFVGDAAKSAPKRSLTRSDFEAMKRQQSDSEPQEDIEGSPREEENEYEEEAFDEESSIASNISY